MPLLDVAKPLFKFCSLYLSLSLVFVDYFLLRHSAPHCTTFTPTSFVIYWLMSHWFFSLLACVNLTHYLSADITLIHYFVSLRHLTHYSVSYVTLIYYSIGIGHFDSLFCQFCYLDLPYVTLGLSYVISVCLMSLLCHLASHYPNFSRISRIVLLWLALSRIFLHFSHISHFLVFWSISSLYFLLFPVHAHDYYWTVYLPCAHYILLRTLDPKSKSYFVFIGSYRSLT